MGPGISRDMCRKYIGIVFKTFRNIDFNGKIYAGLTLGPSRINVKILTSRNKGEELDPLTFSLFLNKYVICFSLKVYVHYKKGSNHLKVIQRFRNIRCFAKKNTNVYPKQTGNGLKCCPSSEVTTPNWPRSSNFGYSSFSNWFWNEPRLPCVEILVLW